ncbi:hypothetical protein C0Z20_00495 [Trinickia symbiotica]|uniref:Porin n=1 Tax=Trinickia symbiotica TaxID=863227 RepID=A0A2N7X9H2_9BURK|nr:hypothetical protein C0Z20_00495 [Trinickia symbiotica]
MLVALTACSCACTARADGFDLGQQLSTLNGVAYARSITFTGGNALIGDVIGSEPANARDVAALVRIDQPNVFLNARALLDYTGGTARTDGRLNELGARANVTQNVSVTVGKRIESLDVTQAFFPLAFFEKHPSNADIFDRYGDVEGAPIAEVKWVGERSSLQAMVGNNHTSRTDTDIRDTQGASQLLRFATNWAGGSASVLAGGHAGHFGSGGTFSMDVGANSTFYGGGWIERGSTRDSIGYAGAAIPATDPAGGNPIDRRNSGQYMWRTALGMQTTLPGGIDAIAEWQHDEARLDAAQWRNVTASITANSAAIARGQFAAFGPLVATANFLSTEGNLRDYFFVRLGKKVRAGTELSARALYSPQDKGLLTVVQVTSDIDRRFSVDLALSHAFGGGHSEYRVVGFSTEIDAALRVRF